ncbi:DUF2306 domain-containing protein [Ideonella sp.]|uniref:DUF2306 domain-containing protein n=1 Tax=Ideonella sp. TaxID=1929293 RepID=UPI003BB530B5
MHRAGHFLLIFMSLGVAGYAVMAYGLLPFGALVHPDMRITFQTHALALGTHVFASALALVLGPFQFSARWRAARPQWHRWSGRAYLSIGVLLGGLSGLYMAFHAYGGMVSKLGFGALALAWLYTGARAFLAIRQGDVAAHRRWMVRNFALTWAAVTLRIDLPLSMAASLPFDLAYPAIAWLCWVPNLVVAEMRFNRR